MVSSNPDLPRILSLWNILENKYVQKTIENVPLIMPNIRVNKKIGIPMLDRPIIDLKNINAAWKPKEEAKEMGEFNIVDND